MARNYAALPHEYLEEMECLGDAEFGRLCRALIQYSADGTPIALNGNERFYAKRVMAQEDRFQSSYEEVSKKRSEAGAKGAESRWQSHSKNGKAITDDGKNGKAINAIASDSKNGYTETNTKTNTNTPYGVDIGAQDAPINLPLNDGSEYPITDKMISEWSSLYPAVDVLQQLRSMRGWLLSNPTRKKTKSGIMRFVNTWLSKEQNSGKKTTMPTVAPTSAYATPDDVAKALELFEGVS